MHFTHRALWFFLGSITLVVAIIGVFLPLLPTTPFLLLASACFMRSSPRIHHWLITHPFLGPPIVEWQKHRTIKKQIKQKAVVMIVISFLFSIIFAPILWVKCLIAVIAIAVLLWFTKIPTS